MSALHCSRHIDRRAKLGRLLVIATLTDAETTVSDLVILAFSAKEALDVPISQWGT